MNESKNTTPQSKLDWALWWANLGFSVFPLIPGGKLPLIDGWQHRATRDAQRIRDWWTCPVLGIPQDYNVGILTSRYLTESALWVVDVDNKGAKEGDNEIVKLEMEGKDFPPTLEQSTPTGGKHFIYLVDKAVRSGANVLAPGLDIRSDGGFIVGAGSETERGRYEIRGSAREPARAPAWYIEYAGRGAADRSAKRAGPPVPVDQNSALLRAIDYLKNNAPLAIEGSGGDSTTFAVACKVKDFGLDAAGCFEVLYEQWNPRCQPPWSPDELIQKVENAYEYGKETVGAAAPEAQFEPVPDRPRGEAVLHKPGTVAGAEQAANAIAGHEGPPLHKLNREHALIYIEGSHFVLHETVDEKGRDKRSFLSEVAFKRKYSPYTTQRASKGKPLTWAEEWLDWKGRREYAGLCFTPEREPRNGYYNLWRGFTCKPVAYDDATPEARRGFDAWIEHVRTNVCHGNEKLATWLLTYFAHLVQRPWERPLTTIVFRGSKGVGKNAPIDRLGQIFGTGHFLVAHDGRYLTSNFNGHLDSCLILVLDEAFWSGDKNAESKLKGLTTAPEIMIERKGKEPYMIDNLTRIVVIGNEEWLVPASSDERRYAVFDVAEGRKEDREFFDQMRVDMDFRGGKAVLLHYLQAWDLKRADINGIPKTAALLDQKHASLEPFDQWWLDCLSAGHLVSSDLGGNWAEQVETDRFRSAFRRYTSERNVRARIPSDTILGRSLARIAPGVRKRRIRRGQELLYVYEIPSLAASRAAWEKFIGHAMNWGDHDGD